MTSARGGGVTVVEECANAIPAGTGASADFLLGDHLIGPKKDQAEINERGGFLATHPKLDFGHTFAHEGLELEKKIFVTSSTRRKRVA